jgi:hypothetical protein
MAFWVFISGEFFESYDKYRKYPNFASNVVLFKWDDPGRVNCGF